MTNTYFFFLGSHPEISAAECWSVLTARGLVPELLAASERFLLVALNQQLPSGFLRRLGGIDRIAQTVAGSPQPWVASAIVPYLPAQEKFILGLNDKRIAHELKKLVRGSGGRMKFVLPKSKANQLNAAQVIFNKLAQPPNIELMFIEHTNQYYLAKTVQVQDVAAYEYRDTRRPARPGKVGMLPPKLAQMMLNLAVPAGKTPGVSTTLTPGVEEAGSQNILDSFCGAGTVLQEGWLMGYRLTGSDMAQEMIAASQKNLDWLTQRFPLDKTRSPKVFQHDVRQPFPVELHGQFDAIVSEPHLGSALTSPLPNHKIEPTMTDLGNLYLAFFKHAHAVLKPGGHILFLLPGWRKRDSQYSDFWLFPEGFIDEVAQLGYSQKQLIPSELASVYPPTPRKTLLYSRPDAFVGRELTLWQKNNGP